MFKLKVFGERNTSTNALIQSVSFNAPDISILPSTASNLSGNVSRKIKEINETFNGLERSFIREEYIDSVFQGCDWQMAWKHSATNFEVDKIEDDVKVIINVRHPASWLLALHRRPYHALQRVEENFNDFICQPWKTVRRDNLGEVNITPVDLWNLKCQSYIDFYNKNSTGDNIFFVKFEDFSQSQENALNPFLNAAYGNVSSFSEIVKSPKSDIKNSKWYREYYGKELWKKEISHYAFRLIEERVDKKLCEFFSYEF